MTILQPYIKKAVLPLLVAVSIQGGVALAYPAPVAVITNYDDLAGQLVITRANGEPDGAEALLYPGDQITGNVGDARIECAPYTAFQSNGTAYVIRYDPPSGISGVLHDVCDYLGTFWSNVESVVTGASRGNNAATSMNPLPGYSVTLFPDEDVLFSWDDAGTGKFIIKDKRGKTIWEKNVKGQTSIILNPAQCGLKAEESYTWVLESVPQVYKIVLLDQATTDLIRKQLAEIDRAEMSDDGKRLRKAQYVQLLSDMYPESIDLYWLSMQYLEGISASKEKDVLFKKCHQHLDREMEG